MKKCEKIRALIIDYLTGQIELSDNKELLTHLKTCKNCQHEMETMEYSGYCEKLGCEVKMGIKQAIVVWSDNTTWVYDDCYRENVIRYIANPKEWETWNKWLRPETPKPIDSKISMDWYIEEAEK